MPISPGNMTGTVLGKNQKSSGAKVKENNVIFIRAQARRYSAKEGATLTGMTPKGFQKLQQGENSISFDKLTEWCQNDPMFAAAYAEHVGLIKPGHAEFVGRLGQAALASQRLQMGGDAE